MALRVCKRKLGSVLSNAVSATINIINMGSLSVLTVSIIWRESPNVVHTVLVSKTSLR